MGAVERIKGLAGQVRAGFGAPPQQTPAAGAAAQAGETEQPAKARSKYDPEPLEDGRVRLPLRHPINLGADQYVAEVIIRRPLGRDLKNAPNGDTDLYKGARFLAGLCGVPKDLFADNVDLEDLARIGEVVQGFFPDGPKDGPTS